MNKKAFTLVEMLMGMTMFLVFMGFATGSYLTFYRAQQDLLETRVLLFEANQLMEKLGQELRVNELDYDFYLSQAAGDFALQTNVLALLDDAGMKTRYVFDGAQFTVQEFDARGEPLGGFAQPRALVHAPSEAARVAFEIFPPVNPYENQAAGNPDLQYQPLVTVELALTRPGRFKDAVDVDLRSSFTSRTYKPL